MVEYEKIKKKTIWNINKGKEPFVKNKKLRRGQRTDLLTLYNHTLFNPFFDRFLSLFIRQNSWRIK